MCISDPMPVTISSMIIVSLSIMKSQPTWNAPLLIHMK